MAGTHVHLGTYETQEEAATVFDRAALVVRGDKAKLNYPAANYHDDQGNLIFDEYVNAKIDAAKEPGGPSGKLGKRKMLTMGDQGEREGEEPASSQRPRKIVRHNSTRPKGQQDPGVALWACLETLSSLVPEGGSVLGVYPDMSSKRTIGVLYSCEDEGQEESGRAHYVALIWQSDVGVIESQPFSEELQARSYIKERHEALHSQAQQAAADAAVLAASQIMQMASPTELQPLEGDGVQDPNALAFGALAGLDMATLALALTGIDAATMQSLFASAGLSAPGFGQSLESLINLAPPVPPEGAPPAAEN